MFKQHPDCHFNDNGEPTIPARCLPDFFATFKNQYGYSVLDDHEMSQLDQVLAQAGGDIDVGPQMILALIASRTGGAGGSESPGSSPELVDRDLTVRGRLRAREEEDFGPGAYSRSSSRSSNGTAAYHSRPSSRNEPRTPSKDSVFDVKNRQRTTPLKSAAAPSSWTRPAPPRRRRSDAGQHSRTVSDSEVRHFLCCIVLHSIQLRLTILVVCISTTFLVQ